MDDIWPGDRRNWKREEMIKNCYWWFTNIRSQFNNFAECAFVVNLTSIRSFEGYNVVWLTVFLKKDYKAQNLILTQPISIDVLHS